MKKIGILGGMSPESTGLYYEHITRTYTARYGDFGYPEILIYSVSFQHIMEWQRTGHWDEAAREMASALERLRLAGADFGLIATNTMHYVFDKVQDAVGMPLLSIVDAAVEAIREAGLGCVGLLGTTFTMRERFFLDGLEFAGIRALVPNCSDQVRVHDVIFQELCRGEVRSESRRLFLDIVEQFRARGSGRDPGMHGDSAAAQARAMQPAAIQHRRAARRKGVALCTKRRGLGRLSESGRVSRRHRCVRKGAPACHLTLRRVEDLDESHREQLTFFETGSLDGSVAEIAAALRLTERKLRSRRRELARIAPDLPDAGGIVARSATMRRTLNIAERVAHVDSTILIVGETGSGKEAGTGFSVAPIRCHGYTSAKRSRHRPAISQSAGTPKARLETALRLNPRSRAYNR